MYKYLDPGRRRSVKGFDESQHPRDDHGKWTSSDGSHESAADSHGAHKYDLQTHALTVANHLNATTNHTHDVVPHPHRNGYAVIQRNSVSAKFDRYIKPTRSGRATLPDAYPKAERRR